MGELGRAGQGPRCIALVGPFQSGKTTLLEAILARTGASQRVGTVDAGTSVGDAGAEARAHRMSVEANWATVDFFGEPYAFVDCPGSVEFLEDMRRVLPAIDAAVVVCEPDDKKVPALQVTMRLLEDAGIPRFLFLNKIDKTEASVQDALALLQPASRVPLMLRQLPITSQGVVSGFIDLALERAFIYREHAPSKVVDLDDGERPRSKEARYRMLEKLADHDDSLLEQLLEEIEPPRDRVFDDLAKELRDGHVVPVLLGSALHGNGVLRLLKALRHEAPGVSTTASRNAIEAAGDPLAYVMKSMHTPHGGKLSVVRLLRGAIVDGATVSGSGGQSARIAAMQRLTGAAAVKVNEAGMGETVALAKLDPIATGELVSPGKPPAERMPPAAPSPAPVLAVAVTPTERKDEVKVSAAVAKLLDEDPSYRFAHDEEAGEMRLEGQGEMHLRVAVERLSGRFGVDVTSRPPRVGYRETIRKATTIRGRHKKQTGGHGQFGDVVLEIAPLARGEGFKFAEKVTGGVVPRQFFPSVEKGVRDFLKVGPLGFPMVDLAVTLTDGSYHAVDSSDAAFQAAARIAMSEGVPQCQPVLLEPVLHVEITIPSEATAKINAIVAARRGQILGFDARPDWAGWDVVVALMPEADMGDLIVELRSASAGTGSFVARFDHLAELSGRLADQVVASRQAAE
jgi:elongation factor G